MSKEAVDQTFNESSTDSITTENPDSVAAYSSSASKTTKVETSPGAEHGTSFRWDEYDRRLAQQSAKISELELIGLEREHRVLYVFINLARYWNDTERWWRAFRAYISWQFSPGTIALGAGTATAILGLVLAYHANWLLGEQNSFVKKQSEMIEEQNRLLQNQTELTVQQTALLEKEIGLLTAQNALADSARRAGLQQEVSSILTEVANCIDKKLNVDDQLVQVQLPPSLQGRIVSLLLMARPYRYYADDGGLSSMQLSPERAMLAMGIQKCGADISFILTAGGTLEFADFSNLMLTRFSINRMGFTSVDRVELPGKDGSILELVDDDEPIFIDLIQSDNAHARIGIGLIYTHLPLLKGASFERSSLTDVDMVSLDLEGVTFASATLVRTDFASSDLSKAIFRSSILSFCHFCGAILPDASAFSGASLDCRQLVGGLVLDDEAFLDKLKSVAAVIENYDDVELISIPATLIEFKDRHLKVFQSPTKQRGKKAFVVRSRSGFEGWPPTEPWGRRDVPPPPPPPPSDGM